jgi:hypothetical protein
MKMMNRNCRKVNRTKAELRRENDHPELPKGERRENDDPELPKGEPQHEKAVRMIIRNCRKVNRNMRKLNRSRILLRLRSLSEFMCACPVCNRSPYLLKAERRFPYLL